MKKWEEGALASLEQLGSHLDNCLGCLACQTACPSGVQYGTLLNHYREEVTAQRPANGWVRRFKRLMFQRVLPSRLLLNVLGFGLWVYQRSGLQMLVRQTGMLKRWPFGLLPSLAYWEALSPVAPSIVTPPLEPGMRFGPRQGRLVALHTGCMMDTVFRPVHWATIRVLVANGFQVVIPSQACCGALAHHAGETDIARELAGKNLAAMDPESYEAVLFNSAGCGAEMRHEYAHLFEKDSPLYRQALALGRKTQDVLEFLANQPALAPMSYSQPVTATYHAACHLRHAQNVVLQPLQVLQQVPGLTLVPLEEADTCCGSAGVYNLEHETLSGQVLQRKMSHVTDTGAALVLTANPGCQLQLAYGIRLVGSNQQVIHPVQLLAAAYGPDKEYGLPTCSWQWNFS